MPVARRVLGESDDTTLRMRWNYADTLHEDPGATLVIPFSCRSPGCGVAIGVTRSYMPLGLADVFVRIHNATARTLFQPNVSAADPELHRNATNITVHRFLTVVPPCSDGMGLSLIHI